MSAVPGTPAPLDAPYEQGGEQGPNWVDLVALLVQHRWLLLLGPLLAGLLALGGSYLVQPKFTARTSFVPPQQQQNSAAAALSQLGALGGLLGASGGLRTPADQYVALMRSVSVSDRIIDQFKLQQVYDEPLRVDARDELLSRTRISVGKKDGLISVEVDDTDPQRAAAMANRYVDELRELSSTLALTEAQQRRAFFEQQLQGARDRLTKAQQSLQASGFNSSALRAEPKAVVDAYARLRADLSINETRLQILRRSLTDTAPEVAQQLAVVRGLRTELGRLAATENGPPQGAEQADYISRYREFKYEETLFELLSSQFELARLDESREGALIQVVDVAAAPERKSSPRRGRIAAATAAAVLLLLLVGVVMRHAWHLAQAAPETAASAARLRKLWRGH